MRKINGGLWGASLSLFFIGVHTQAASNDLVITSITHAGDCTTLTWISHPREFYTVYWTDALGPNILWRVAEVNVPSGGTDTTWSEGNCTESMMAGGGSGSGQTNLSAEQREAFIEKHKDYVVPDYLYPPGHPKAPKTTNQSESAQLSSSGGESFLLSGPSTTGHKFYRVARTAVAGFVDGWGATLGSAATNLAALGDAFAISASPRLVPVIQGRIAS